MPETLPEGTDAIVPGAMNTSAGDPSPVDVSAAKDEIKSGAADLREKAQAKADEFRAQAADRARDYAEQGKTRASDALGEFARLIGENATQIDDKIGSQYGDYARRAADYVAGTASTLRDKDVDDLIEDARALVRSSPTLAIGAAATAGFLLARIIKSGSEALEASVKPATPTPVVSADEPEIGKTTRKGGGKRKSAEADRD